MKALLVIDIESIDDKNLCADENKHCPLWNKEKYICQYCLNTGEKHCPLKSTPKKMVVEDRWYSEDFARGYNLCIDEILGETDDRDI